MEQLGLGRAVFFHAAVVVQMVAGKVGKHRRGELHTVDAELIQAMAGYFHAHHAGALATVLGQLLLYGDRVGCGVGGFSELAIKAVAHRTDQGSFFAQQRVGLRQPVRNGGLAIGAGNADYLHVAAGVVINVGSHNACALAQAGNRQIGHLPLRAPLEGVVLVPQHRSGAFFQRGRDKVTAIGIFATTCQEYVAGKHAAAVCLDACHGNAKTLQLRRVPIRQIDQVGLHVSSRTSEIFCSGIKVLLEGASGSTPMILKLPAMMLEKAGPATVPP